MGRLSFHHKFEEISPFGSSCRVARTIRVQFNTAGPRTEKPQTWYWLVLWGIARHDPFARRDPEDDRVCVRALDALGPINDGSGLNFCSIVHWP